MKRVLLAAINAKYIHSNPAVYALKSFALPYQNEIHIMEYTINHQTDDILQSLYKNQPDILAFSCYIWNISMIEEIIREYRKLDRNVKIWMGGPEVSYDSKLVLQRLPEVDGVMCGEGEETFFELLAYYLDGKGELPNISGLVYRNSALAAEQTEIKEETEETEETEEIEETEETKYIDQTSIRTPPDFSSLPFPYEGLQDTKDFANRILYYETSRGCPFHCSYCLSSISKAVRFRDISMVEKELIFFLDNKVTQVKLVDRTFNCNKDRALHIWQFIKDHDNGITNFHFEIAADLLDSFQITLLNTMRPGQIQLEIGVQSTNTKTLQAILRQMDLEKVAKAVAAIKQGNNIHQHLDLIAGLPYEDYQSFGNSFNQVYKMEPDQLQLGFLKVLKGSFMFEQCEKYGIVYKSVPPYEVLYTNWLSYYDTMRLKALEEMVEVYYNSSQFRYSMQYLTHFFNTPFEMYEMLADYYECSGWNGKKYARIQRYEILWQFLNEVLKKQLFDSNRTKYEQVTSAFAQILTYDVYLREKAKSRPEFSTEQEAYKGIYKKFLLQYSKNAKNKEGIHLEHFTIDVKASAQTGHPIEKECFVLFDYSIRDPFTMDAKVSCFSEL